MSKCNVEPMYCPIFCALHKYWVVMIQHNFNMSEQNIFMYVDLTRILYCSYFLLPELARESSYTPTLFCAYFRLQSNRYRAVKPITFRIPSTSPSMLAILRKYRNAMISEFFESIAEMVIIDMINGIPLRYVSN